VNRLRASRRKRRRIHLRGGSDGHVLGVEHQTMCAFIAD
jgi:hypothetical protein